MHRPYVLADSTWAEVKAIGHRVAVLPWGATEAHNTHLPYTTDNILAEQVATRAAQYAWDKGAKVVVLPTVPFGVNTTQLDIPLTLNITPSTQLAILRDIVASLEGQDIHKLLILNGHGGNDFRQIIRELYPTTKVFLSTVNWWSCVDVKQFFDDLGDHAGEAETSALMHLSPQVVRPLDAAGEGHAKRWKLEALREGWVWSPRQWTQVTADTGIGNPARSTAGKGEAYVNAAVSRIGRYLVDLDSASPENLFE
jgi:creatinine amidohydrolase